MTMRKALLLLFFLAGIMLRGTAQNITLVVTTTDGEEQIYQLADKGQLFFEDGDQLVIEDGLGATVTFPLSDIQKIVCSEITSVDEGSVAVMQLIPNPTRDRFIIKNIQNSCEGRVYTLDGRLMKTFEAAEGVMIDISDLATGMYLLHIDGQTLKMMKL